MITSHQLAKRLLDGPVRPVVYVDCEYGPELVSEMRTTYVRLNVERTEVVDWKPSGLTVPEGFEEAVKIV